MEWSGLWIGILFGVFFLSLLLGIPVAWALGGSAFLVTAFHQWSGGSMVEWSTFSLSVERIYGLIENDTLVALPMFILMGHVLDKSGVAGAMMESITQIFGRFRGGLAMGVVVIGVILAATTGIIGASVVLLATMCLPPMIRAGYSMSLTTGTICSAGTLGILIPPSIMLVVMADRLQLPVADLFSGNLVPGLLLAFLYIIYISLLARFLPTSAPSLSISPVTNQHIPWWGMVRNLAPVMSLVIMVLGSIYAGWATPTEASGLGALGAILLGILHQGVNMKVIRSIFHESVRTLGFLFAIFIGASCFSLCLRLLGGDDWVRSILSGNTHNSYWVVAMMLILIFVLGFFLDWIEITLIVLPIVSQVVNDITFPWAETWGGDKAVLLWFAILCALVLQTSFLTPPVGFALFYLKGAVAQRISPRELYLGVLPFVLIQLSATLLVFFFPVLVHWLPSMQGR